MTGFEDDPFEGDTPKQYIEALDCLFTDSDADAAWFSQLIDLTRSKEPIIHGAQRAGDYVAELLASEIMEYLQVSEQPDMPPEESTEAA